MSPTTRPPAKPATKPDAPARTRTGVVASDARDKTRTVTVERQAMHPKYGKIIRRQTVLQVHDEANASRRGDTVEISECRPISRSKCWRLVRVVQRAAAV